MSSADPFYAKYEKAKRIGEGGFGTVLLVRRKKSSGYFAAKFLDPTSRKYGSDSQELRILESLDHECVIRLIEAFEPYSPAPSRRSLDPSQPESYPRERKELVLVFPAYDMDLKWLLRLRADSPEEFPEEQRTSICKDVFRGLAYLHGKNIMHRDIKPANIFVRFGKSLRAVLGDVGLGSTSSSSVAEEPHTAYVCSDGYVAPELLGARPHRNGSVVYGCPIDVWSAGVVTFEVATMTPFLPPGDTNLAGIARRIGPPPAYCVEDGPLTGFDGGLDRYLHGGWYRIGLMCLDWLPYCRSPAAVVATHEAWDRASPPPAMASSAAAASAVVRAPSPEISTDGGHYPPMTDRPVDLGPVLDITQAATPGLGWQKCACSGNCGTPGHRRALCQAEAAVGSLFCSSCSCKWLSCVKPRTWKGYCHKHVKEVQALTPTWRIVLAASRLNQQLVPCDVPSFIAYYSRHRSCLPSLVVAAFVKEPAALEKLEGEARRTSRNIQEAAEFRECWLNVIRKIGDGEEQRSVELRQLTRNGTGRVSGLGPTLTSVGILMPSHDAGSGDGDVSLGLTRRAHRVNGDDGKFLDFWKDFADESWATIVRTESFAAFCIQVRTLLQRIAKRSHALGLAAEGYCFHFLYRKLLIGEAHLRNHSTSFAAVDWHTLTVGDLKYMSADQKDHLSVFDSHTSAGALSHFFFGRVDWPLLLSCFACLWHEVEESEGDVADLAGSDVLRDYAFSWRLRNHIAPHPAVLLADYRASHPTTTKATRVSKKRPAPAICISDAASPR